ncbi:MAG: translation initiation factor IF-2 subunit beta [Candidatus Altiarchaeota archaeon]|nr:translation initiation factor IF-2 subunit beta [Candidatus Altiarchaeota archaeon]
MDFGYERLLDRAWENLPSHLKTPIRFEMPQADTLIEGNTTIIRNFGDVASRLRREPDHIMKFLFKELAAPGVRDGNRVIMQRVLKQSVINKKFEDYAKEFVLCHECGKPDTGISELEGVRIIKCEACGGWWPMRRIK